MPAPYRYVFDLPGTPGPDAIDATDIGSWFQPEDQTADAAAPFIDAPYEVIEKIEMADVIYSQDDPPDDLFPADYLICADGVNDGEVIQPSAAMGGGWDGWHHPWTMRDGTIGGDDDPFYFDHSVGAQISLLHRPICVQLADTFWTEDWLPEPPPDAIGYEVELAEVLEGEWGPYADVVSADLALRHTSVVDPAITFPIGGVATVNLNSNWGGGVSDFDLSGLVATVQADVTVANVDNESLGHDSVYLPASGDQTVDLSFHVDNFDHAPRYTGLIGAFTRILMASVSLPSNDSHVSILTGLEVLPTSVYYIRPPRIRWIYGRPPYRRLTQRADGRAGGARRIHPRPKTIQGSNRRGAGSIT